MNSVVNNIPNLFAMDRDGRLGPTQAVQVGPCEQLSPSLPFYSFVRPGPGCRALRHRVARVVDDPRGPL